jgi:hypothetical protein
MSLVKGHVQVLVPRDARPVRLDILGQKMRAVKVQDANNHSWLWSYSLLSCSGQKWSIVIGSLIMSGQNTAVQTTDGPWAERDTKLTNQKAKKPHNKPFIDLASAEVTELFSILQLCWPKAYFHKTLASLVWYIVMFPYKFIIMHGWCSSIRALVSHHYDPGFIPRLPGFPDFIKIFSDYLTNHCNIAHGSLSK